MSRRKKQVVQEDEDFEAELAALVEDEKPKKRVKKRKAPISEDIDALDVLAEVTKLVAGPGKKKPRRKKPESDDEEAMFAELMAQIEEDQPEEQIDEPPPEVTKKTRKSTKTAEEIDPIPEKKVIKPEPSLPVEKPKQVSQPEPVKPAEKSPPIIKGDPVIPTEKPKTISQPEPVKPTEKSPPIIKGDPAIPVEKSKPVSQPEPSLPVEKPKPVSQPEPPKPSEKAPPIMKGDPVIPVEKSKPVFPPESSLPVEKPKQVNMPEPQAPKETPDPVIGTDNDTPQGDQDPTEKTRKKKRRTKDKQAPTVDEDAQDEPPPAPKAPPKPKMLINEDSNEEFDLLYSYFSSSFYSLIQTCATSPSDKKIEQLRKQTDELSSIVVKGPTATNPPIKLHKPKFTAPDFDKYSQFQKDHIYCASDLEKISSIKKQLEKQYHEISEDTQLMARLKMDKKLILPVLRVNNKIKNTIKVLYDYPHVIPEVITYQIPEICDDIPNGYVKTTVIGGYGFPKVKDLVIMIKLPLSQEGHVFRTPPGKGPDPVYNHSNEGKIDFRADKIVLLLKTAPSILFVYSGQKQIAEAQFSLGCIFKKRSNDITIDIPSIPGATIELNLQVRRALSGTESRVVNRPIMISPLSQFEADVPKPKPDSEKPKPEGEPENPAPISQNTAPVAKTAPTNDTPEANSEKAKAKLRMNQSLPQIVIMPEQQLHNFWGYKVLEFFKSSSSIVLSAYSRAKQPPPPGLQLMNQIAKSKLESLTMDINENRITEDSYNKLLQKAIEREKDLINSYPEGKERDEAAGRIGMMMSELE